jgi:hypothetical protein
LISSNANGFFFEVDNGDGNGFVSDFFKISPTGKIQVAGAGLNYESKQNYTLTVKITDDDAEAKTAQIIIQIKVTTRVCSSVAKRGKWRSNTLVALILIR